MISNKLLIDIVFLFFHQVSMTRELCMGNCETPKILTIIVSNLIANYNTLMSVVEKNWGRGRKERGIGRGGLEEKEIGMLKSITERS